MSREQGNIYALIRSWFDFAFENPELIKPCHAAVYFFAIEHNNRLGWKRKFGFPSQMVMEAIGIKNWRTYSKTLNDLVEWGFIEMIEISKNQYSSNIIAIVKNTKAPTKAQSKALDKALQKHSTKQGTKQGQSTVSIDRQDYNSTTIQDYKSTSEREKKTPPEVLTIKQFHSEASIDQIWLENLAMVHKVKLQVVEQGLKNFCNQLALEGETHKTWKDGKSHFARWFNISKNRKALATI